MGLTEKVFRSIKFCTQVELAYNLLLSNGYIKESGDEDEAKNIMDVLTEIAKRKIPYTMEYVCSLVYTRWESRRTGKPVPWRVFEFTIDMFEIEEED